MTKTSPTFTVIILVITMFFIIPITTQAQFSGGNGTENNPYIITTAAQLAQLATYVNEENTAFNDKYYKLANDIDLSNYGSNFNNGKGWIPIGIHTGSTYFLFKGNFDGDNHTITNLYINAPDEICKGLFGNISNSIVKNLSIEDININASSNVGGIMGQATMNSTVINCHASGSVSGGSEVGGVAGGLTSSVTMNNCSATGNVNGITQYIGGVVGSMFDYCNLNDCYSSNNINSISGNSVGGMAGRALLGCNITGCYATGSINGFSYVGGVIGKFERGTINKCYATGNISGNSNIGGIVGYYYGNYCTFSSCAALNQKVSCSNTSTVGRIVGYFNGTLSNNIAFSGMLNYNNNTNWSPTGATTKNGENISKELIHADGTLGNRFTTPTWTTQNGMLPGLFGSPVNMPQHLLFLAPQITTEQLPNGITNIPYSQTLSATGDTPITWSHESGSLPTGLTISAAGVISGTTATKPTITTTALPDGKEKVAYSHLLVATGTATIIWSLETGELPTGLSLSEEGLISGTPTKEGTCNFVVTATNSAGSDTKALSIFIEKGDVGIFENDLLTFTVFPNPTNGELQIEIAGQAHNDVTCIEIFDIYGRNVSSNHRIPTSSNHHINISHLPAGIYFLCIQTDEGRVMQKVVKY